MTSRVELEGSARRVAFETLSRSFQSNPEIWAAEIADAVVPVVVEAVVSALRSREVNETHDYAMKVAADVIEREFGGDDGN